jgi:hypothetical protein
MSMSYRIDQTPINYLDGKHAVQRAYYLASAEPLRRASPTRHGRRMMTCWTRRVAEDWRLEANDR